MIRLVRQGTRGFDEALAYLQRRAETVPQEVEASVREILESVRREGNRAVLRYTRRFDGVKLTASRLRVSQREVARAFTQTDPETVDALRLAARRITRFHEAQREASWIQTHETGILLGQVVRPLERVGLYVPGGRAAYPSTVLMNAIPARVAGVGRVIMCCPATKGEINPAVLVAASLAGVDEIYRIGGAQAIAAMAYGTETLPRVDKIVGPGNLYVAAAKRLVFGTVDIDMVAGPSEVLVIADDSANPSHVAADLLAQAEHDEQAWAVLVTDSPGLARRVRQEVSRQMARLPRRKIAEKALQNHGWILLVNNLVKATLVANAIAPEHLELAVRDPFSLLNRIQHAGAIFLGHHTPEALGDYLAGPNHVLPTGGTARFFSPLGVADFLKRSSVLYFTGEGLDRLGEAVIRLAEAEGLDGHGRAVRLRLSRRARW